MTAIDIGAFVPVDEFKEEVDRLVAEIKASPVMPGFEEVLLPGEREHRAWERRRREGIPVDEWSWNRIVETCGELGIDAEGIMREPLSRSPCR